MKLIGDIPKEHLELAEELEVMEIFLDKSKTRMDKIINGELNISQTKEQENLSREILAKSYTCLAHDWYGLNLEEEGLKLLLKAEGVYPGYFSGKVKDHANEDEEYGIVISNLKSQLVQLFIDGLAKK